MFAVNRGRAPEIRKHTLYVQILNPDGVDMIIYSHRRADVMHKIQPAIRLETGPVSWAGKHVNDTSKE
jgi:hypothetical protein